MLIATSPDHLFVQWRENNKVKSINPLQLHLELSQLVNENLLL